MSDGAIVFHTSYIMKLVGVIMVVDPYFVLCFLISLPFNIYQILSNTMRKIVGPVLPATNPVQ